MTHSAPPPTPAPPLPAVVFCTRPAPAPEVAALTVLDRLLVALHRAGCQPIQVVAPREAPRLRRAPALGIRFTTSPEPPSPAGPVMIARDDWLLTVADCPQLAAATRRRLTGPGRLDSYDEVLPAIFKLEH